MNFLLPPLTMDWGEIAAAVVGSALIVVGLCACAGAVGGPGRGDDDSKKKKKSTKKNVFQENVGWRLGLAMVVAGALLLFLAHPVDNFASSLAKFQARSHVPKFEISDWQLLVGNVVNISETVSHSNYTPGDSWWFADYSQFAAQLRVGPEVFQSYLRSHPAEACRVFDFSSWLIREGEELDLPLSLVTDAQSVVSLVQSYVALYPDELDPSLVRAVELFAQSDF